MNQIAVVSIISIIATVIIMNMPSYYDSQLEADFEQFISEYGKSYTTQSEYEFRKNVFKESIQQAAELQELNPDATFGVTIFSDWTEEEFSRLLGDRDDLDAKKCVYNETKEKDITSQSVDWTSDFQPIQSQGSWGGCWAFAAAASFEFYWKRSKGKLVKASEQQLISCDKFDHGCHGGLANRAYFWLSSNASCTEQSYPYEAQDSPWKKCTKIIGKTKGCQAVARYNETALKNAVLSGPISVSVDSKTWKGYKSGIIKASQCGKNTNHAVVIVGFGTDSVTGMQYYKIRNHWSHRWGEEGYARLEYGNNTCNISKRPSYPII